MNTIAERLNLARQNINDLAATVNRKAEEIQLLAVSKTKPTQDIFTAYENGQRQFGENYVQEGIEKVEELSHLTDIEWHFIGPLQSNKTKAVAEHFDWVQSIDREKIALRLNNQRPLNKGKLKVCLQVNISQEESKSGIGLESSLNLAKYINTLENLELKGIMAIPSKKAVNEKAISSKETNKDGSDKSLAQEFAALKDLFEQLKALYPSVDTLSMGMSNDQAEAITHGSTMLRIGTAIFGARDSVKQN